MSAASATGGDRPRSRIDHLVVVAAELRQGAEWCADLLGVVPGAGGRHPLMATHNRLLKIGAAGWPDAYLEIIAVDPQAAAPPADGRSRWFGIDSDWLQRAVAQQPRLVHFVAATADLRAARLALAALGDDVGEIVAASRSTAQAELRWQITVRRDGLPQYGGGLPALIEWQGPHPAAAMAESAIRLRELRVRCDRPAALRRAWSAIGLEAVELDPVAAPASELHAVLSTPRGEISLVGGFAGPA